MNREELAWAAGFFDGEGTIYVSHILDGKKRYRYPTMRIKVTQAGKYAVEILERFREAVGGIGKIYGPMTYKAKPHYQDSYSWEATNFEQIQAVFAMLWVFLSGYKKFQITKTATEIVHYHRTKVRRKWLRS